MDQDTSEINKSSNHVEIYVKDDVSHGEQSEFKEMQISGSDQNVAENNTASSYDTECLPCLVSSDALFSHNTSEIDISVVPSQNLSSDFFKKCEISDENSAVILGRNCKSSTSIQASCGSVNAGIMNDSFDELIMKDDGVSQNQLAVCENCQELLRKSKENCGCQGFPKLQSNSAVQHDSLNEVEGSKITDLENEKLDLMEKLKAQETVFKETESQLRAELLSRVETLSRECDDLRKEKEAFEIEYVNYERQIIVEEKLQADLEKDLKVLRKHRLVGAMKLRDVNAKNDKLSSKFQKKEAKIEQLQEENARLAKGPETRILTSDEKMKELQEKLKNAEDQAINLINMGKRQYELCEMQQRYMSRRFNS